MRIWLCIVILLCLPQALQAAEVVSGDVLALDDGRQLRLQGIKAEGASAVDHLKSLLATGKLVTESASLDRYGRLSATAYVETPDGQRTWLQGALLQVGEAFVYPPEGTEPHLDDMLQLEQAARTAKAGIWSDEKYRSYDADSTYIPYGQFAFVTGTVVKAERVKSKFYLNFGDDWRKDFTVAIAAHDLRLFRKAGIDPLTYQGKTLRIRGWVIRNFGPMIMVTHPAQIEVLGEAATKN